MNETTSWLLWVCPCQQKKWVMARKGTVTSPAQGTKVENSGPPSPPKRKYKKMEERKEGRKEGKTVERRKKKKKKESVYHGDWVSESFFL